MDPKKKFQLFKQSEHFCSAPWNMFKIDPDGSVNTCVPGLTRLGNIKNDSIQDIVHGPAMQEIRSALLQNQPHPNCQNCTAQENGKFGYLRNLYNEHYIQVPVDYTDIDAFTLSGIDLQWSSTCNLKCVMCWEKQSSAIAQESRIPILTTSEAEIQQVTNWLIDQQSTLKEIYLSGGEPTLIKHNLRLLQALRKDNDFLLRVNTNLTFDPDNQIMQEILKFPRVMLTVSADATHDRFDYIRSGSDWKLFNSNLLWLNQTHVDIRINFVFFVATAPGLIKAQTFFRETYGITDFTVNNVVSRPALLARNLPEQVKNQVRAEIAETINQYRDDINLVGQLTNCLTELDNHSNGHSYAEYFDQLDAKRGTNWRSIFTELV